jgi:hypothetical protein
MTAIRYVEALCADCAPSPLQSVITWIPVSERLPEDGVTVLIAYMVFDPRHNVVDMDWSIGFRQHGQWHSLVNASAPQVTHYAPVELPQLPVSEDIP